MLNRSYVFLLVCLICGVFLVNLFIYKYGLGFLKRVEDEEQQVFSILSNITDRQVRLDVFEAVISPPVSCAGRDIELVICVPVKRDSFAKREAIRQTWGSYGRYGGRSISTSESRSTLEIQTENGKVRTGEIILMFFIGSTLSPSDAEEQERIDEEVKKNGDIFQDSYIDTYKNLTLKSISIIKWISKKCPNARYVAKIDDDMYVNIPLLVTSLRNHATEIYDKIPTVSPGVRKHSFPPPFLVGFKNTGAQAIRDKKSKWYTSEEVYKDKWYPSYLSGTAYGMSGQAAVKLYDASLRVPLFWMEDIYITGLCARIANVPLIADDRFHFFKMPPKGCAFREVISGHRYTITQMKRIHKELTDPSLKCK
ncbi:hypothetical protein RRG08_033802 [Elysia crispata]|uniref:Hexosyltransferase n=1 Tax=Elysia crispata TaxID=231223 RepID=A0AAE1CMQ3_9GAST|nr:hypothetical protein RRG08_033802 [Elysia crispata]